jgi:RNA polymerase sigma-70 factor (ECF subfamily)
MAQNHLQTKASDEQLVHAALDGDISAFGCLVERYWNMVFALALSRIDHRAEAEDIAQESFLKAYAQLHALRDPSRFAGWLSKITRQQCTNAVRKNLRCRAALDAHAGSACQLEAVPAYSSNPGLTDSQMRFVRQTVGRLPDRFRQLVIMRFMGGLSAVQIAEQLGKRPGTVRVSLHRAYNILRKDLAPLLEEVQS